MLRCPLPGCGAENAADADACVRCTAPLRHFGRLSAYPAQLFNAGLAAARAGDLNEARELFAAVVHWCPMDAEARNALALASYQLDEHETAQTHWQAVLDCSPGNPFATEGLGRLPAPTSGTGPASPRIRS
ncbi:hypothetical protein [Amycolatopsis sp. NPDC051071]|uniref:hypothetical protein n=1 Tax=Amycolatopsis sp. NPDC051071 TaxID=3154637 RepID=UPI00342CC408